MGQQTIKTKTFSTLVKKAEKDLKTESKKKILKEEFLLGKGHCKNTVAHNLFIIWASDDANCNLSKKTNKFFRGETIFPSIKKEDLAYISNSTRESELYSLWLSKGNIGTIDTFLDLILKDEDVKLDTDEW